MGESNTTKVITFNPLGKYDAVRPTVTPFKATYEEMTEMKSQGKLIPGQYYQITDYVTTVNEATITNARSAGHAFDILVRADSANTLNEQAWAVKHDDDTYFKDARLEAWELKYRLDNVQWSKQAGKGTITWMKDEHGNECPYDFKNVQFKRWKVTDSMEGRTGFTDTYLGVLNVTAVKLSVVDAGDFIWSYTFSSDAMGGEQTDYSLDGTHSVYGNIIKEMGNGSLPYNVFFGGGCYANTLSQNCSNNSFSQGCSNNSFSQGCYSNSFSQNCQNNSFSQGCSNNSFSKNCQYNSFSQYCSSNSFSQDCSSNSFSQYCSSNSFSQNCYNNSFSQNCQNNSFSQNVQFVNLSNNYMQQVIVESGNQHLNVVCSQSTSSSQPCRNIKIEQGVGNSTSEKTVTITTHNQNYQTVVKNANSVEVTA